MKHVVFPLQLVAYYGTATEVKLSYYGMAQGDSSGYTVSTSVNFLLSLVRVSRPAERDPV